MPRDFANPFTQLFERSRCAVTLATLAHTPSPTKPADVQLYADVPNNFEVLLSFALW
jgi:hypothetical protein